MYSIFILNIVMYIFNLIFCCIIYLVLKLTFHIYIYIYIYIYNQYIIYYQVKLPIYSHYNITYIL